MMEASWNVEETRSPEEVFTIIKTLPKPLCIVTFGADSDHKNLVFDTFHKQFADAICVVDMDIDAIGDQIQCFFERFFEEKQDIIIKLPGRISCEAKKRKEFMKMLRVAGAASLVGVYAKIGAALHTNGTDSQKASGYQAAHLIATPPTPRGLERLITVKE